MKLNTGHYFEALDRVYTIQTVIDAILSEHPAIVEEGLQKDVDKVQEVLSSIYQKLGEKDETWEDL